MRLQPSFGVPVVAQSVKAARPRFGATQEQINEVKLRMTRLSQSPVDALKIAFIGILSNNVVGYGDTDMGRIYPDENSVWETVFDNCLKALHNLQPKAKVDFSELIDVLEAMKSIFISHDHGSKQILLDYSVNLLRESGNF